MNLFNVITAEKDKDTNSAYDSTYMKHPENSNGGRIQMNIDEGWNDERELHTHRAKGLVGVGEYFIATPWSWLCNSINSEKSLNCTLRMV